MSNRTELHDKIQQITAKIIDLNAGFASKTSMTQLDADLLRKYTVDLYDTILQLHGEEAKPRPVEEIKPPVVHTTVPIIPPPAPVKEPEQKPEIEPTPPHSEAEVPKVENVVTPPPVVEEKPVAPKPVEEEKPFDIEVPEVEIAVTRPVSSMPVQPLSPPPAPPVIDTVTTSTELPKEEPSLNDRLQTPEEGKDIASKMQQTPIHDLKKAISINKKFEFINQLFKGDHEAYAKSIHYINGLSNNGEAGTFFNNLKKQFGWDEENKLYIELAEMIRRRFM